MPTTSHLLMIRPVRFDFNAQTAVNNAFQQEKSTAAQSDALAEFDDFVNLLRESGVHVTVIDDSPEPHTPDSIFPNNWVSFHLDGTLVLYPMFAENRRLERKSAILDEIARVFQVRKKVDLTGWERKNRFLEGTGSLVLDRENRLAYACLSPRTDPDVLEDFCRRLQYRPVPFQAMDSREMPIYHTNVMMCVGDTFVVVCLEAIPAAAEREMVERTIRETGKALVPIRMDQMNRFAGNMLQVESAAGEKLLVMSSRAFRALDGDQIQILGASNRLLYSDLSVIETNGGGSARCMMTEVFLPPKAR